MYHARHLIKHLDYSRTTSAIRTTSAMSTILELLLLHVLKRRAFSPQPHSLSAREGEDTSLYFYLSRRKIGIHPYTILRLIGITFIYILINIFIHI